MSQLFIVSVTCSDRPGLIATLSQRLFELGANLGDSAFSVLGRAAHFSAICDFPKVVSLEEVKEALTSLDETTGGEISVHPFAFAPDQDQNAKVTHNIQIGGGDRPGLVTRLAEVFQSYDANIVHMKCMRSEASGAPETYTYTVNISANIPDAAQQSCINTIANTAGELKLTCQIDAV